MARLIDADKLIKYVKQEPTDGMYVEEIIEAIDEQPTAYDIDKVVEQLEKLIEENPYCSLANYRAGLFEAIEIVKGGADNA